MLCSASSSAYALRLGGGSRCLRRSRVHPVGRRHRLARGAGQGATVQAGDEGRGSRQAPPPGVTAIDAGPGPTAGGLPGGSSTSAPRTVKTSRFVGRLHLRRRRCGAAAGEASRRRGPGPTGRSRPAGLHRRRSAVRAQRPSRPGGGRGRRRRPRRSGRRLGRFRPGGRRERRHRRSLHPRSERAWPKPSAAADAGPAPVDYLSAGPVVPTPTKPGRPGTGIGYLTEATHRSAVAGLGDRRGGAGLVGPSGRRRGTAFRGGPMARRGRRPGRRRPTTAYGDRLRAGRTRQPEPGSNPVSGLQSPEACRWSSARAQPGGGRRRLSLETQPEVAGDRR